MSSRRTLESCAGDVTPLFDRVRAIPAPDLTDPAVAEFATQFGLDVSSLDDGQRERFLAATGDQAFAMVQRVYAADFAPRVVAVLDAAFGPGDWPSPPVVEGDAWPLLEEFMAAVARLDSLDAPTTELVRLRGARQHDCRLCKSRRNQDAIDAGAGDAEFAAVDHYRDSDLPAATRAALALTDALIWTPTAVPPADLAAAREHLSPAQIVEVILDVMRNAANKIAVSLGADAPTVTDGVELFTTDADGNVVVAS